MITGAKSKVEPLDSDNDQTGFAPPKNDPEKAQIYAGGRRVSKTKAPASEKYSNRTSKDSKASSVPTSAQSGQIISDVVRDSTTHSLEPAKTSLKTGSGLLKDGSFSGRRSTIKGKKMIVESLTVPINKMSLKLYGSQKAVKHEQERLEKAGSWIIHPYSNFRLIWDCVTLVLLLVNITLIPVAITFWKIDQPSWLPFKVSRLLLLTGKIGKRTNRGEIKSDKIL